MLRSLCFALLLLIASSSCRAEDYDIVVYGGISGGVTAAVQAVKMGKTVAIIEPGKHLGGLSAGGLGATDIGNKGAIGGLARGFYKSLGKVYGKEEAWTFEPHVAEKIFEDMVREFKIPVFRSERLDLKNGVKKEGTRIVSITMESGKTFTAKMFIDATYEGDLMAKAGVSYTVGREANAQYGETLNGVAVKYSHSHQFTKKVDPYITPGDPKSGLIAGIQADGPGEEGAADKRVQAYNFRMCMTDVPDNMIPWPKPANYDEKRFELLLRNVEAGDLRVPYNPVMMPNRKTDTNNNFAVSTDNIGMNYEYPEGDYALREKIIQEHKDYQMGLMWTLANHPRVPAELRAKVSKWGLAKDEFKDYGGWPHQLYVREARRMISDYVMTQHNCQARQIAEDSVGMGAYTMDSHHVQRYVTKEGFVRNEGDVQVGGFKPYPISYRSIVPKESECSNLFVPVCLSATHISYGSIRMEPVFMVLGQSAATAAVHAIDEKVAVQKIDYKKLQERLLADGQVLFWTAPTGQPSGKSAAAGLNVKDLEGIVVDDSDASVTGTWTQSASAPGFVGNGYIHDGNDQKGEKTVKFTANINKEGRYDVRISYTALSNRASNAPITIAGADETKTVKIDQRKAPPLKNGFISVGTFSFKAGAKAIVTISNKDTDGHVIVDAVQIVPVE
ncbi:MAG TPA: FAD-dependent oxidoreductase [Planctomycetota bacterium]|nr:FAD-dependent oxidoreductase [Planctomycetota bacterium]